MDKYDTEEPECIYKRSVSDAWRSLERVIMHVQLFSHFGQHKVNANGEVIAVLSKYAISCGFTKEMYGLVFNTKQKHNKKHLETLGNIRFQNDAHGYSYREIIVTVSGPLLSHMPPVIYYSFIVPTISSIPLSVSSKEVATTPSTPATPSVLTSPSLVHTSSAQKALTKEFQERVTSLEQNDDAGVWNEYERATFQKTVLKRPDRRQPPGLFEEQNSDPHFF
jgi:hypothetical protein